MATTAATTSPVLGQIQSTRKPVSWSNLLVGAAMNLFQGQSSLHGLGHLVTENFATNLSL
jgi:hypothetical protein